MIVRRAAMSSSVGSSKDTPREEENVATSRLAATMSAYLLTDQKPDPSSGDQATGASRRSRPNSSYGTARAHMSRSVRSTMLFTTGHNQIVWHQTNRVRNGPRRLTAMRVLVIRHHDVDTAGFIADAFEARGASLDVHLFPDDGPLPALDGVDHIIVMGAVSSVNDPDPWIAAGTGLAARRPTRPACRCSASASAPRRCAPRWAAGSRPWDKEIGWFTVESADEDAVPAGPWLEFHEDRCLLPAGATVLARNDAAVQAFRIGRHLAVQFHPEVDGPLLKRWLDVRTDAETRQARHRSRPVPGRHHPRGAGLPGPGGPAGRHRAGHPGQLDNP